MNYNGNEPYIFISYSHSDRLSVEYILGYMIRAGIRFWYDNAIEPGDDWKKTIDERLENSSRFLLFLSNVAHHRDEVIRELRYAAKKNRENPSYKIIVVVLEYVPINYIFGNDSELSEVFSRLQYLSVPKYGGITFEFLNVFLSRSLWSEDFRNLTQQQNNSFMLRMGASDTQSLIDDRDDVMKINNYIYSYARPDECEINGIHFHKVKIGETDKNAVYPMCMDNQWCPPELISDENYVKYGFSSDIIRAKREIAQLNEIYRALLHNWQLIINRASVFNTDALISLYTDKGETGRAFCELMENGSIVVFLFREDSPVDNLPEFDYDESAHSVWKRLCSEHSFYFIRLDWNSSENNKSETDIRLAAQFRNMLMCVADDANRLKMLCDVLNIPNEKRNSFRSVWKDIRMSIIFKNFENTVNNLENYNREDIYKTYITLDGTKVNEGILDRNKPFVTELKQVVDLCYSFNLPYAIGVRPVSNYDDELWNVMSAEINPDSNVRLLSVGELYCAVMTFVPDFIETDVCYPTNTMLDMSDLNEIRKMPQWHEYMQMVDSGRKRASLNEIDYSDIRKIWTSFHRLLAKCRDLYKHYHWILKKGSLTVIYHFGEYKLTAIYNGRSDVVKIIPHKNNITFSKARSSLRIEFVCVDVTETDINKTPFFAVQCLFDGKISETSKDAYNKIFSALKENKYIILENDKND